MDVSKTTNDIPAMPPAIAAAVVKVMGQIRPLEKNAENKFHHYRYASIDGFLETIGPLCAGAGLFILADEVQQSITEPENKTEGAWLNIRWAYTLAHESGVTYGPLYRTQLVPANGAQAFGANQSYSLKQFMRGLFQIPTGDNDDPDENEKRPIPKQTTAKNGKRTPTVPQDAFAAQSDPTVLQSVVTLIERVDVPAKVPAAEEFIESRKQWLSKTDFQAQCEKLVEKEKTLATAGATV